MIKVKKITETEDKIEIALTNEQALAAAEHILRGAKLLPDDGVSMVVEFEQEDD